MGRERGKGGGHIAPGLYLNRVKQVMTNNSSTRYFHCFQTVKRVWSKIIVVQLALVALQYSFVLKATQKYWQTYEYIKVCILFTHRFLQNYTKFSSTAKQNTQRVWHAKEKSTKDHRKPILQIIRKIFCSRIILLSFTSIVLFFLRPLPCYYSNNNTGGDVRRTIQWM